MLVGATVEAGARKLRSPLQKLRWIPKVAKVKIDDLEQQYTSTLRDYLARGGKSALRRASRLSRQALESGLGALDILEVHHKSFAALLALRSRPRALKAAGKFLAQCLAPFELTRRGLPEAHAALRASEGHYRRLFERSVAGIFRSTPDGRILDCNEAFARMLGCASREEVLAHQAWDFYFDAKDRRAKLDQLRKQKALTNWEVCLRRKDGSPLWALVNENLLEGENGKFQVLEGTLIDITERKRAEEALRHLNEALEEQAKRIAHELHDEAGQLVTSIYLALNEIAREVSDPVRKRLRRAMELLDQIEVQQRRLCHELRPRILDDQGLVPALEFLAKGISARAGISVGVESPTKERLPSSIETALYRIVQEGLTNVTRHARASHVRVRLRWEEKAVHCSIEDDGTGFDVGAVLNTRRGRGLGLLGIWQRLDPLHGWLTINSKPEHGTQLLVTIPLELKDAEHSSARGRSLNCPPRLKGALGARRS